MNNIIQLETIQIRLRTAIRQSPLSQKEIAQKIGVSAQTVSKYMQVNVFPALDTLGRLCQVLDVSADYLLGLTD